MKFPRFSLFLGIFLITSALSAASLRIENLTPDGWFILIESHAVPGGKVTVLTNSFIGPWKENLERIDAADGATIYVSVHKTRNISDNREQNREKLKVKLSKDKKLAITAGQNGEPKVRLF